MNSADPLIKIQEKTIALAHVDLENLEAECIRGDIEPLVGREWSKDKGAGNKVSEAVISLTPGTCFTLKNNAKLKIGDYGIWKKI